MNKIFNHYPWLYKNFKFIVNIYNNYNNNIINLILYGNPEVGSNVLLWKLTRWLLCSNNNLITYNSCFKCINCKLLSINNHPDVIIFHKNQILSNDNDNDTNSLLNNFRQLQIKCVNNPIINNKKIFIFPYINNYNKEILTIIISLIKLKPYNNCFLFNYTESFIKHNLISDLVSYCFQIKINNPSEYTLLIWLHNKFNKISIINLKTIIRINKLLPNQIIKFIANKNNWISYNNFIIKLINIIYYKKNPLILLKLFNNKSNNELNILFDWLISFLIDLIKLKYNDQNIVHLKFYQLILIISKNINILNIISLINIWLTCIHKYNHNILLNNNLFILEGLSKLKYLN